jgi:tetratricopeptide (TPR) repeat protein
MFLPRPAIDATKEQIINNMTDFTKLFTASAIMAEITPVAALKSNTLKALIIVASLTLSGCANQAKQHITTAHNQYQLEQQPILSERQRADLYEAIIAADIANSQGDHLTAMSYYLYAAELSQNQKIIEKSIASAKAANDDLGLEQAAEIWLQKSPHSLTAKTLLLEAQFNQRDINAALNTLISLLNQLPTSVDQYELLSAFVIEQEAQVANYILQSLLKQNPADVAVLSAQAKFYFLMATQSNAVLNQKNDDNRADGQALNPAQIQLQSTKIYAQSYQVVEQALQFDPLFVPAINTKVHIYFQLHQDVEARQYLQQLMQQAPNNQEIEFIYGQLLYDLRDYQASANHYKILLNKYSGSLKARRYLAASYYALENYDASLAHFNFLVDKGYQQQTSAFYCGSSALKLKMTETNRQLAIKCFSQVEQGRFLVQAKIQLAGLYASKQNYEKALEVLTAEYDLEPNSQVQLVLAEINLLNQHFSPLKAKQRLSQALEQSPDNLGLILKKIELYQLLDKPDALLSQLSQARDLLTPGEKLDRYNLAAAALLHNNKHYQLAQEWLSAAIKAKPDDKDLLYTRALYKEVQGLYDEMIFDFKHLLTLFPDDLHIKNALGYTLADRNQQLDYAQALIDSAYQGLANNVAVIDSKGWLAYRQGKLDTALEYLNRAYNLAPSPESSAHLGEVLWQKGLQQKAQQVWQQGIKLDKSNRVLVETLQRFKQELLLAQVKQNPTESVPQKAPISKDSKQGNGND